MFYFLHSFEASSSSEVGLWPRMVAMNEGGRSLEGLFAREFVRFFIPSPRHRRAFIFRLILWPLFLVRRNFRKLAFLCLIVKYCPPPPSIASSLYLFSDLGFTYFFGSPPFLFSAPLFLKRCDRFFDLFEF